MRSLAPNICDVDHQRPRHFSLNPKAPLLRVWPDRPGRNRGDIERKDVAGCGLHSSGCGRRAYASGIARIKRCPIPDVANAWVADRKLLRHAEHDRRARLERTGIGFVARAMLKENAITTAD